VSQCGFGRTVHEEWLRRADLREGRLERSQVGIDQLPTLHTRPLQRFDRPSSGRDVTPECLRHDAVRIRFALSNLIKRIVDLEIFRPEFVPEQPNHHAAPHPHGRDRVS